MFHLFLQSFACGFAFIVGAFVVFVLIYAAVRRMHSHEADRALQYHRESLAALEARNAQWRPSQIDFFAAEALPVLVKFWQDRPYADGVDAKDTAEEAFKIARAMAAESAKHQDFVPAPNLELNNLLIACKYAECTCSIAERDSGHRVGCWMPDLKEAMEEARQSQA